MKPSAPMSFARLAVPSAIVAGLIGFACTNSLNELSSAPRVDSDATDAGDSPGLDGLKNVDSDNETADAGSKHLSDDGAGGADNGKGAPEPDSGADQSAGGSTGDPSAAGSGGSSDPSGGASSENGGHTGEPAVPSEPDVMMTPGLCGDGELNDGEDCDDGANDGSYGGCKADCRFAGYCGDGTLDDDFEECDDGNGGDRDGCDARCRLWFDQDFTRRTRIDLTNPTSSEADSFPVLVTLNDDSIDWDQLGNAGLCFVDDDGATVLATESEVWLPGSASLVWVRLPALTPDSLWDGSGSDHLWLYYGNFTDSDGCAASEPVWRDEFAGVWHMADSQDSSIHGHDMADTGTTDAPGAVGRGRATDYAGNLAGPSDPALQISGDITISAWASFDQLDSGSYHNCLLSYGSPTFAFETNFQYGLYASSDRNITSYWAYGDSTSVNNASSEAAGFGLGELHHYAMVRDSSAGVVRYYFDGTVLGTAQPYDALPDGGTNSQLRIGGNIAMDDYSMVGVIDEVRIANRAVNTDWIALEYLSMAGGMTSPVMDP